MNTARGHFSNSMAHSGPDWIFSWDGLEMKKAELERIAHEVYHSDAIARQNYRSSVATGLICQGITHPEKVTDPVIARASKAQKDLETLHLELVNGYHLEFDFVRLVWAPILDPSEEERVNCEKLVEKLKRQAAKKSRK